MRKRLTRKGLKIRRTRRINQVNKRLASLNIGANDKENLFNLLTQKVQTKAGVSRSKKLEKVIFSKSGKGLTRFKEFKLDKFVNRAKTYKITLSSILKTLRYGYWQDSESAFMSASDENRQAIKDFNNLSATDKLDKNNAKVQALENAHAEYLGQLAEDIPKLL